MDVEMGYGDPAELREAFRARRRMLKAMMAEKRRSGHRGHQGHEHGPGHEHGHGFGWGGRGFGWDPGFGGPLFGRGPKVGRGNVRAAILALLAEEPMHGYQIIQELGERSGGRWRPSPGSIYPTLQQLEDEGLVRAEERDGKRTFTLTDAGRAAAAEAAGDDRAPWERVDEVSGSLMELRDLAFQLAAAVMQVARAGNANQMAKAKEILAQARRAIYRLLAEDDAGEGGDA